MLIGIVLRLGNVSQVAVEHFDEAVYASNLLFPPEVGGEYPFRQLYAPPLLPAVIEWTTIIGQIVFGRVPTWWPVLPGLICGLATIPSAWWIGRQWFSPRAGIVAALLVAGNDYHAAYSRTALTDVPLTLFVLWAVHWFWRALQTGAMRDAVIAGGFTALAWWTKYNGWLPLAIAAAGGTFWQLTTPRAKRHWSRLARVWLIGAATAVILWSPVWWDCQKVGGYSAVAANHQRYVDGFEKWGANFWQGMTSLNEFGGSGTAFSLVLLILGWRYLPRGIDREDDQSGRQLATCLITAWFWGLMVSTPLYFPYPRLWCPWVLSGYLALAAALPFTRMFSVRSLPDAVRSFGGLTGILFALTLAIGLVSDPSGLVASPSSWESRREVSSVAGQIQSAIADPQAPVFVHSDPALWYHLRQRGQPTVIANGLAFLNQPLPTTAWLAIGPQGLRDLEGTEAWKQAASRLESVGEYEFTPSRIVLLDHVSPRELREQPDHRTMTIRLYKILP